MIDPNIVSDILIIVSVRAVISRVVVIIFVMIRFILNIVIVQYPAVCAGVLCTLYYCNALQPIYILYLQ